VQVVPAHVEDWRLTGAGLGAYRRNIDKMLPIGLAISNAKEVIRELVVHRF